jgi:SAM-dependent methyltransferase
MNFEKIYAYRFAGSDEQSRQLAWGEIASFAFQQMGRPATLLDPACGRCEFLHALPDVAERWGVDRYQTAAAGMLEGITFRQGDIFAVDLPKEHFSGVFISNLLEHLASQEEIFALLERLHEVMRPGGVIAILGPNFKYAYREYFDCADHRTALSHLAVEELLYAAGFTITRSIERFLPFSFRSRLPANRLLIKMYLQLPLLWKLFGKQFFVLAQKPFRQAVANDLI